MSTRYEQGRGFAYRVSRKLADNGYEVIRSAGSKTKVDIVAFKSTPDGPDVIRISPLDPFDRTIELLFVQVKKADDGYLLPAEHAELRRLAYLANATALVAYLPPGRKGIGYRRLTGPGPKDWQPWTPDWALETP